MSTAKLDYQKRDTEENAAPSGSDTEKQAERIADHERDTLIAKILTFLVVATAVLNFAISEIFDRTGLTEYMLNQGGQFAETQAALWEITPFITATGIASVLVLVYLQRLQR